MQQEVLQHTAVIAQDLKALMDENIATESESNPALRRMLQVELEEANTAMTEVQQSIIAH